MKLSRKDFEKLNHFPLLRSSIVSTSNGAAASPVIAGSDVFVYVKLTSAFAPIAAKWTCAMGWSQISESLGQTIKK
jgi:hypothetical protein